MNTMLNVRMDQAMLVQAAAVAKSRGYLTTQEYVREIVRQDIEYSLHVKAQLDAITASAKKVKPHYLTKEERDQLAREPPSAEALALIHKQERYELQQLKKLYGSAKGMKIKKLTRAERDKLAEEVVKNIGK